MSALCELSNPCAVVSPLPCWLTTALSGFSLCSKIDSFIILGIILIRIGLDVFSGRDQVWMNYRAGVVRLAETHRLRIMRSKFSSSRFVALRHAACRTSQIFLCAYFKIFGLGHVSVFVDE